MSVANEPMFPIGELAARTGLSRDTLRYYEKVGLLPKPPRTSGGFRLYSGDTVERLLFVQRAQRIGLTLDEIRDLVTFDGQGGIKRCQRVRDLLTTKLRELEARLVELRAFRRTLRGSLALCDQRLAQHTNGECPVVEPSAGAGTQQRTRPRRPASKPAVLARMPQHGAAQPGT